MTCTGNKETITGNMTYIIKVSENGNWMTGKFRTETGLNIMVSGENLPRHKEIVYQLTGKYAKSPRYGQNQLLLQRPTTVTRLSHG